MRKTHALVQVAIALLDDPHGQHWGYELSKEASVPSGVLYPLLSRLLEHGWVTDGWEDPSTIEGRPPRRYYTLTDEGIRQLRGIVASASKEPRFSGLSRFHRPNVGNV
jgi:PadR family transcriptional regulator, regulatory protein PadR